MSKYMSKMSNIKYKSFEAQNIPWIVDPSGPLINSLQKIAESRPLLNSEKIVPVELKLLRDAQIESITYSNQIEGNALSEKEVTAIINGRKVVGSTKDVQEIENYIAAMNIVEKLARDKAALRVEDFFDVQKQVTEFLLEPERSGKLRDVEVGIINQQTGRVVSRCPKPHSLQGLMEDLWSWLENSYKENQNAFIRAFSFHFLIVAIHPFIDGNGRTARLIQHYLLSQSGEALSKFIPCETVLMKRRELYYLSIRESLRLGVLTPFLERMADCFVIACGEFKNKIESNSLTKKMNNYSRAEQIKAFVKKKGKFKISELAIQFEGVSKKTLSRDLHKLVIEGFLVSEGKNKGRVYFKKN